MTDAITDRLRVKIFADGADLEGIRRMYANPLIKGFTTNPTLMRKAGVDDYERFAHQVLDLVSDRPVSFEVFADEFRDMEKQALEIASWGANVNVKIPVTNTRGETAMPLVKHLADQGVRLNVTALMNVRQVSDVVSALNPDVSAIISVFAGRVADTGIDPVPVMAEALAIMQERPKAELLWASPRELLNVFQADQIGCHIITATDDLLAKLPLIGKNLDEYSLETVKMFYGDAAAAGYSINVMAHGGQNQ